MVGDEPRVAMITTTAMTMTASPTTAATHRALNRERLEGGTAPSYLRGAKTASAPSKSHTCRRDTGLGHLDYPDALHTTDPVVGR